MAAPASSSRASLRTCPAGAPVAAHLPSGAIGLRDGCARAGKCAGLSDEVRVVVAALLDDCIENTEEARVLGEGTGRGGQCGRGPDGEGLDWGVEIS